MTSAITWVDIVCPNCDHEYKDQHRASMNLDLDDFDDDDIDEMSTTTCPECGLKYGMGSLIVAIESERW